jgi:hypothetical protein
MNATDTPSRTENANPDTGVRLKPASQLEAASSERTTEPAGGAPAPHGASGTLNCIPDSAFDEAVESSLRKAAAQVYQVLSSLDAGALKAELEEDVTKFTRLVNALARLSEAGLKREWQRARLLEREARQNGAIPGQPGGITPETLKRIQEELELL